MDSTTWNDIVGQDMLIENLQSAIKYNKISHAYLIEGERLSGKRMIADIFARALQCECDREDTQQQTSLFSLGMFEDNEQTDKADTGEQIKPCNQCRSCRQAQNGNHPDIIYVEHEKPNVISVDNIRRVNEDIVLKPYSGPYKIYIIDEAEKMNMQAQNALLKTLEEPPEYAIILLLTTRTEAMLQTILSRCMVLNIKPVAEDAIKNYLMQSIQVPDYRAAVCASFARGNVGRAIELASNEAFDRLKSLVISAMKNIADMEIHQMSAEIKKITEEKFDKDDYLDLCFIWFRDVLLYKACGLYGDTKRIIFKEERHDLEDAARRCSYEGIEKVIHSISRARSRIAANVNFDLTMELMFLDIKAVF